MAILVRRDRLLVTLRLRHELTLCGLVAPAGFGRTVVLDQAAADLTPEAADIRYICSPGDDRPGELAIRLSRLLTEVSGSEPGDHRFDDVAWSATHLSAALAACDRRRPTALCLDRF
jgi:ATP/maltotriose-dependent transcriptional regulator MalT